ncbi:CHAP domain-containing protein [Microbispora sp. RL4-1S]|uniref:CHAP domain-containing protein n=2 Tax=Microbispora oryzae TaxID=2806554 RepID=A0A941AJN4_9ACTN|nr:CHAP domain-containing protein [Microbispora oryzae]
MLATARKDLGLVGRPNHITREYASRHGREYLDAAWCDMSVTYWARHSGNADAVLPAGDRAYTVAHAQDGKNLGRWYAGTVANVKAHAKPGALILFDWDGTNNIPAIDHIGVIEHVLSDGRVQTIEANTGNACKRRVRAADVIAGFWNPDYEGEDMPSAKEIADEVYERLTGTVTKDVWAAREGLLDPGQKLDPRTFFRQAWAYGKGAFNRLGEVLKRLDEQAAELKALREEVAELRSGDAPAEPPAAP